MKYLLLIAIFLFTNSCNFMPKLEESKIDINDNWQFNEKFSNSEQPLNRWWKILKDKTLDSLVDDGLKHNYDIKIALANIEKSRLEKNITTSDLFPDVDYGLSSRRTSFSNQISNFKATSLLSSTLDLSWKIDLWGSVRNDNKAAKYDYLSQIDTKNAMSLSISAEIIKNYIELRRYQKLEITTIKNIKLLQKTIRLTKIRENAGIATNFDVARTLAQKEIIEATLPNIGAQIYTNIHKLSVLIGKNPTYLKNKLLDFRELPEIKDFIAVGLPSEILKRRPDIKAAENLMIARNSQIGSSIANFFPSFSLTGSYGNSSKKFSGLFGVGNKSWQYGLNLPIFRAGELIARYKITKEDKKISILNYEKTILNAFMEVEDNLVKYFKEMQTRNKLNQAVENNKKIVGLAEERYGAGLDNLLEVINVKRNLIEVENSLIESESRVLINLTDLIKALGGGVEDAPEKKDNITNKKSKLISLPKKL